MDYLILVTIGVVMGFFGGLLGIGGSVVMIPAMVFIFGENQHLYQASAMICNFFVAITAVMVHKNADALMPEVIKWLVPFAAVGIIVGVALSNSSVFARSNSYFLARLFGVFMIYVIIYNLLRFGGTRRGGTDGLDVSNVKKSASLTALCGLLAGLPAGLLGIGGGIICVPAQQLFLKMPLKRAISNSAATIAAVSLIGAFYKNLTLPQHNIGITESLKIAIIVIPGSIIGAFIGGWGVYKLPRNIIRAVFVVLAALACYKLLTVMPAK